MYHLVGYVTLTLYNPNIVYDAFNAHSDYTSPRWLCPTKKGFKLSTKPQKPMTMEELNKVKKYTRSIYGVSGWRIVNANQ